MAGKKVEKIEKGVPKKVVTVKKEVIRKIKPDAFLKQAAEMSSMCRAVGMNITIPNMAIIIRLAELHKNKGTKSSLDDIQNIVTGVYQDPRFQPQQQQS